MPNIFYSSFFIRQLKNLTPEEKSLLSKFEKLLRQDPFYPKLKTHKLSGKLKDYWAGSLNFKIRIMFEIKKDGGVVLIDIGSHDIYK